MQLTRLGPSGGVPSAGFSMLRGKAEASFAQHDVLRVLLPPDSMVLHRVRRKRWHLKNNQRSGNSAVGWLRKCWIFHRHCEPVRTLVWQSAFPLERTAQLQNVKENGLPRRHKWLLAMTSENRRHYRNLGSAPQGYFLRRRFAPPSGRSTQRRGDKRSAEADLIASEMSSRNGLHKARPVGVTITPGDERGPQPPFHAFLPYLSSCNERYGPRSASGK